MWVILNGQGLMLDCCAGALGCDDQSPDKELTCPELVWCMVNEMLFCCQCWCAQKFFLIMNWDCIENVGESPYFVQCLKCLLNNSHGLS